MKQENDDKRRSFLKQLLAGTATVVGAAALVKPAKAGPLQVESGTGETLYRETPEFQKYYKSLRS